MVFWKIDPDFPEEPFWNPEYLRIDYMDVHETPFRTGHMSKVPGQKFSWKSTNWFFQNREHKFFSYITNNAEDIMKNMM